MTHPLFRPILFATYIVLASVLSLFHVITVPANLFQFTPVLVTALTILGASLALRYELISLNRLKAVPSKEVTPPLNIRITRTPVCNHQYEVSSPIDTVEMCVRCGDRQPCAPLIPHTS